MPQNGLASMRGLARRQTCPVGSFEVRFTFNTGYWLSRPLRQPAPLKERRILERRQIRRPAGEFFQRVSIHDNPAPDPVDARERLSFGRNKGPQGDGRTVLRLTRDIEADM